MNYSIEYRNCTKVFKYGPQGIRWQPALRGVSLSVRQGEIVALLGLGGAGKTTLLQCAVDLVRPTGGSVALLGFPSSGSGWRGRAGYLPEAVRVSGDLDAGTILRTVAALRGLSRASARRTAEEWIERLKLPHGLLHNGVRSREADRRCSLAAALIGDPDVLLLDEPTGGCDPVGRREIRSLLLDAKRRGAAVLISSQDLPEIEEIADRVAILRLGELVTAGKLRTLMPDGGGYQIIVHWEGSSCGERSDGRRVIYHARDGNEAGRMLAALRGGGGEIVSVTEMAPTLEEVFQRYAV